MKRQVIRSAIRQTAHMQPFLHNATGYRNIMSEAPVRRTLQVKNKKEDLNKRENHFGSNACSEGDYLMNMRNASRRRSLSMPSNDRLDLLEVRKKSDLGEFPTEMLFPHEKSDLGKFPSEEYSGKESALIKCAKTFTNREKNTPSPQSWLGDERLLEVDREIRETLRKEHFEKTKNQLNSKKTENAESAERESFNSYRKDGHNKLRSSRRCSPQIIEKPIMKNYDKNTRMSSDYKKGTSDQLKKVNRHYDFLDVDTSQWKSYEYRERRLTEVQSAKPMTYNIPKPYENYGRSTEGRHAENIRSKSPIHNRGTSHQAKDVYGSNYDSQWIFRDNDRRLPAQFEKQNDMPRADIVSESGGEDKKIHEYGVRIQKNGRYITPIYNGGETSIDFNNNQWTLVKEGHKMQAQFDRQNKSEGDGMRWDEFYSPKTYNTQRSYQWYGNRDQTYKERHPSDFITENRDQFKTRPPCIDNYQSDNQKDHSKDCLEPFTGYYETRKSEPSNKSAYKYNEWHEKTRQSQYDDYELNYGHPSREFHHESHSKDPNNLSADRHNVNKRHGNIHKPRKVHFERKYDDTRKQLDYEKMEGLTRRIKNQRPNDKREPNVEVAEKDTNNEDWEGPDMWFQ